LQELPPSAKARCLALYAVLGLPHLVCCALDASVSADARWGERDTPVLCIAAQGGSERVLKALLDGGANPTLADKEGWTAAHVAASSGHTACLRLLIDAGAELGALIAFANTPLHCAAQAGHAECCALLLASGSNANARTSCSGDTPLLTAIGYKHPHCVRVLLPASDLGVANRQGRNAFHTVIITGCMDSFELMLPLISDVDVPTVACIAGLSEVHCCVTPLLLACSFGQERMVKALLHRGASRVARDNSMRTPLHAASLEGHLGCARRLLGKPGAYLLTPDEVNAADGRGCTPLHYAAQYNHANLCGMLVAAGARLDAVTTHGLSPLAVARHFQPFNMALLDVLSGRGPANPPGTACDECGKPEPAVLLSYCTGCLRARYCGCACAVAAWPAHRAECQRVKAAREERCSARV